MPQMCWWISKVDIWCGSPYPAKHLDDLSACRVRKCNDLSHQKYDFFSSPWNWNVTCTYFWLIWRTWHPKKKQHSIMRKKTSHGCWKIFHTTQWSKYSVYYALSQKCQCSWHHFFCPIQPHGHSYWCDHMRLRMPCSKKQTNKKRCSMT